MIIDALVGAVIFIVHPLFVLLPPSSLGLPTPVSIMSALSGLDSLIPVLLPLQIAAGMLAALGLFFAARIVVWLLSFIP